MHPDGYEGDAKLVSVLSSLPLVTATSSSSRRRAEPPSSAAPFTLRSESKGNTSSASTSNTTASSTAAGGHPTVPAPLGTQFQPATATAQMPTVSAHVSAAQRRASAPIAASTPRSSSSVA